ncbi:hypothetical protein JCM3774_003021 [Rhodotorula dairenensis]
MFYSSAQRALLYDPTRAMWHGANTWRRMGRFLRQLLRKPTLGRHVKRLDELPTLRDLIDEGMEEDYANWLLTLDLLCPSLLSITIPMSLPPDTVSAALRVLVSKPDIRSLSFDLVAFDDMGQPGCLRMCQDFLADLDLPRLECLQLPPIEAKAIDAPELAPVRLPIRRLILRDMIDVEDPDLLSRYFDLRNVRVFIYEPSCLDGLELSVLHSAPKELRSLSISLEDPDTLDDPVWRWDVIRSSTLSFPCLTQLTLGGFAFTSVDLADITDRSPLLRVLDFSGSTWSPIASTADLWIDGLRALLHLRQLRTGTLRCPTASASSRFRNTLRAYCDRHDIALECTRFVILVDIDTAGSNEYDSDSASVGYTALCACCEDSHVSEGNTSELWPQQPRVEDEDDFFLANEWLRSVSAAGQHTHDYERFARDGLPWHWVFDALGRPIAVLDDFACVPAVAFAREEVDSDWEDAASLDSNASVEYISPLPDVSRLEDGYVAYDDEDGGNDEDAFTADDEPWLTWSEPCDFDEADAAWTRFDIDDQGNEVGPADAEAARNMDDEDLVPGQEGSEFVVLWV